MQQLDTSGVALASFFLGVHIAEISNNLPQSSTPTDKLTDLLIQVAEGDATVLKSGAEIRSAFPDHVGIEETLKDNQETHEMVANLIIRRMQQNPESAG